MRLWHQDLIPKLPRQQLLGQWRECIALLGNGWGRKHRIVDYVFTHPESYLVGYTYKVYSEMTKRGYHPDLQKIGSALRKRNLTYKEIDDYFTQMYQFTGTIYPEHNTTYYRECIDNLRTKNIELEG
jgi:uncharacterized protein (TIGR02328 family)